MASDPTAGKNQEGPKRPGGYFKAGTGGHTSRGVHEPARSGSGSGGAKSKRVNRIGNLGTRTHGAGGKIAGI